MQNKSDLELMQLVLNKHRPALEQLYDRYVKLVYSFAMKSMKNEHKAREIVQLVFTRLWTTQRGYDPAKGQFVNWLLTVTRNIVVDEIRKEKKHSAAMVADPAVWGEVSERSTLLTDHADDRQWIKQQIQEAYQYLSESQAALIDQMYWQGYSLKEIAQMHNEPLGTIKSRLHQTLKILRKYIAVRGEE